MRFVFILTAALAVCAQAAPQFNNLHLRIRGLKDIFPPNQNQWNNENRNQHNGVSPNGFPRKITLMQHRRPNDHNQNMQQNDRGSSGQCWDPTFQIYRDWPNALSPFQYISQSHNNNFPAQMNHNPSMYPYPYPMAHWGDQQPSLGPPRPPHYHHLDGPPPPHHHHHHHHHHHQHEPQPLPPRPTHPPNNGNGNKYELELCEDTSKENVRSEYVETTTLDSSGVVNIPRSSPAPTTSVKPVNAGSEEIVTQSTIDSSVEVTTEFDWNKYFPPASVNNPGGAGSIDVRGSGITGGSD